MASEREEEAMPVTMLDENITRAMTRMYFDQDEVYASMSRDRTTSIAGLPPQHARNAAAKLLREAQTWMDSAGLDESDAVLWLISTPLHRALVDRAREAA